MGKEGGGLSPLLDGKPAYSIDVRRAFLNEQRVADQLLFDEAVGVGCDWLEASGGKPLALAEYERLYRVGFVSHRSEQVLGVFFDWDDYQQVTAMFFADKKAEKAQREENIFRAIQQECELGLAPRLLLQGVEHYKVKSELSEDEEKRLYRYRFTDSPADQITVIQRYYKYRLADHLLKDRSSGEEVTDERKLSIALGFNILTGKPLSSFVGSLKNSRIDLTPADVEREAEELGIYEYVYPSSRGDHLTLLLRSGRREALAA